MKRRRDGCVATYSLDGENIMNTVIGLFETTIPILHEGLCRIVDSRPREGFLSFLGPPTDLLAVACSHASLGAIERDICGQHVQVSRTMYDDADISFSFLLLPPSWHSRLLLSAGEAAGGMEEEEGGEGEQDDYPAGRGKKGEAGGGRRAADRGSAVQECGGGGDPRGEIKAWPPPAVAPAL